MGCAATVRGALEPLPGVISVGVEPGRKAFPVTYDPARVTPAKMLEALRKAGEEADPRPLRSSPPPTSEPARTPAVSALLDAFDRHLLVALIEAPGLAEEHDLLEACLRDPRFPACART